MAQVVTDTLESRVYTDEETDCWLWRGGWTSGDGYGKVWYAGKSWMAHRLVWTFMVGRIPPDLVLDHYHCFNRACVNPRHLQLVTSAENTHRGEAVLFRKGQKYDG
jgi:hypothetical protein